VIPAILSELARDEVSELAIEAAGKMSDESLLPALEALLTTSPDDQDVREAIANTAAWRDSRQPSPPLRQVGIDGASGGIVPSVVDRAAVVPETGKLALELGAGARIP